MSSQRLWLQKYYCTIRATAKRSVGVFTASQSGSNFIRFSSTNTRNVTTLAADRIFLYQQEVSDTTRLACFWLWVCRTVQYVARFETLSNFSSSKFHCGSCAASLECAHCSVQRSSRCADFLKKLCGIELHWEIACILSRSSKQSSYVNNLYINGGGINGPFLQSKRS